MNADSKDINIWEKRESHRNYVSGLTGLLWRADTAIYPGTHVEKLILLHLSSEVNWQVCNLWHKNMNNLTITTYRLVNIPLSWSKSKPTCVSLCVWGEAEQNNESQMAFGFSGEGVTFCCCIWNAVSINLISTHHPKEHSNTHWSGSPKMFSFTGFEQRD